MKANERAQCVEYLLKHKFKGQTSSAWLLTHPPQHASASSDADLQRGKDGIELEMAIQRMELETLPDSELHLRYLKEVLKEADAKAAMLERKNLKLQGVEARAAKLQNELDDAARVVAQRWPWGEYETELLRHLADAARRYWVNYDPSDPTTARTNEEVAGSLIKKGVSKRVAEVMAQILRANGLRTGPR